MCQDILIETNKSTLLQVVELADLSAPNKQVKVDLTLWLI